MILDVCSVQSRIWRFLTDIELAGRAIRSFRVGIAFRFVSALQGCIFLWADSSVFFSTASFFFTAGLAFMAPTTTLCCVSKTFLFSGRTAPSSCLRTNSVGQVAFPCENLLKILLCRQFSCRSFFPLSLLSFSC